MRLYGEPREGYYGGLEMVHPRIKSGKAAETELPKALTPVYPAGEGIQQRWLRKRIDRALLDLDLTDLVPEAVRTKFGLPGLREALSYIHTPPSGADVIGLQERSAPAWRRLIFDELLAQQITLRESRAVAFQRTAPPLAGDDAELAASLRSFPSTSRTPSAASRTRSSPIWPRTVPCTASFRATSAAARPS